MKFGLKLAALLLAALLLTGCVSHIGKPMDVPVKPTETTGQSTESEAVPTTQPVISETVPEETTKPCEHEWEVDPLRPHTATCRNPGQEFFVCKLCKAEKAEEKAAVGHFWKIHSYVAGDCATGITYHQICDTCGAERNKTGEAGEHLPDWENPGRVVAATCTTDGFMYAYCKVCGERAMQQLPATGHAYGDDSKCTACGELKP